MPGNHCLDHPQAESCSFLRLGSEEGFEDVLARVRFDSSPAVGNEHPDALSLRKCRLTHRSNVNLELPFFPNGFNGVADKVGKKLLEFTPEPLDLASKLVTALNANLIGVHAHDEKLENVLHHFSDFDGRGRQRFTVERKHLADDMGHAA